MGVDTMETLADFFANAGYPWKAQQLARDYAHNRRVGRGAAESLAGAKYNAGIIRKEDFLKIAGLVPHEEPRIIYHCWVVNY